MIQTDYPATAHINELSFDGRGTAAAEVGYHNGDPDSHHHRLPPEPASGDANKVVVENSDETAYIVTDTFPDGIKAVTQDEGDNSDKLATTEYVDRVTVPTYSTAADIITAFAAGIEFNIAEGTYDCDQADCIIYSKTNYHCIGDVKLQFADGYGLKTWTAANSARYYLKDDHRVYWETDKWTKTNPTGAGTDYPALTGDWYLVVRGRAFQCVNTSDATHVKVAYAPDAVTAFDTSGEYQWAGLVIPTWNVRGTGNLTVEGKSGHTGGLIKLYGLGASDLRGSKIRLKPPDTLTSNSVQGYVYACFKTDLHLDIEDQKNTGANGVWWWHLLYNNNCNVIEEWQNISFVKAAAVSDCEHVVYHNQYHTGGIYEARGSGAYVSVSSGNIINRGYDFCECRYITTAGFAIDTQRSPTGDSQSYALRNCTPATLVSSLTSAN